MRKLSLEIAAIMLVAVILSPLYGCVPKGLVKEVPEYDAKYDTRDTIRFQRALNDMLWDGAIKVIGLSERWGTRPTREVSGIKMVWNVKVLYKGRVIQYEDSLSTTLTLSERKIAFAWMAQNQVKKITGLSLDEVLRDHLQKEVDKLDEGIRVEYFMKHQIWDNSMFGVVQARRGGFLGAIFGPKMDNSFTDGEGKEGFFKRTALRVVLQLTHKT